MTVTERMVEIFRETFPEFTVSAGFYGGNSDRYAVYTERYIGDAYADDEPGTDRVLFEVAVRAPKTDKLREKLSQFRNKLLKSGFTWPELEAGGDALSQQWLLTFEGEGDIEWQE